MTTMRMNNEDEQQKIMYQKIKSFQNWTDDSVIMY